MLIGSFWKTNIGVCYTANCADPHWILNQIQCFETRKMLTENLQGMLQSASQSLKLVFCCGTHHILAGGGPNM